MDIVTTIKEMHEARRMFAAIHDQDSWSELDKRTMLGLADTMAEKWEAISGWLGQGGWSPIAKDWRFRP